LTPHDRFVPSYRASEHHLRWVNNDVRPDPRRPRDWRPQGLTVVPQDRFAHPGRVDVAHAPRVAAPALARNGVAGPSAAPSAPPPPPSNRPQRDERFARAGQDRDHGRDQEPQHGLDTGRISRDGFIRQTTPVFSPPISGQPAQPLGVNSPTPHQPNQALGVTSPTPHQPPQAQGVVSPTPRQMTQPIETAPPPQMQGGWQGGWQRGDRGERGGRREQFEEQRRERQPMQAAPAVQPAAMAQPVQTAPQAFEARPERERRGGWERTREAPTPAPAAFAPHPMPAPVMAAPAPQPQPARVMSAPPPAPAPAPAPAPQPARPAAPPPQQHNGERAHNDQHGRQQQER
jgi:hypothetical protein